MRAHLCRWNACQFKGDSFLTTSLPKVLAFVAMLAVAARVDASSISVNGYIEPSTLIPMTVTPPWSDNIENATNQSYAQGSGTAQGILGGPGDQVRMDTYTGETTATIDHLGLSLSASAACDCDGEEAVTMVANAAVSDVLSEAGSTLSTQQLFLQLGYLVGGFSSLNPGIGAGSSASDVGWVYQVVANGSEVLSLSGSAVPNAAATVFNTGLIEIPIIDGAVNLQQTFNGSLNCDAVGNWPEYGATCTAYINLLDTAMVGDAEVVDSNGNVVPGVTITSASGYDYTQPLDSEVPEPSAVALLAAGLAAVGCGLRRHLSRTVGGASALRWEKRREQRQSSACANPSATSVPALALR